jgi:hypothetical protein
VWASRMSARDVRQRGAEGREDRADERGE